MIDKMTSIFSRAFFTLASLLVIISIILKISYWLGADVSWARYDPGRLFEFAGIFLLFVTVLLLRQIREVLIKGKPD